MWISPAFSLEVIETFAAVRGGGYARETKAADPALLEELETLRRELRRKDGLIEVCRYELERADELAGLLRFKDDTLERQLQDKPNTKDRQKAVKIA